MTPAYNAASPFLAPLSVPCQRARRSAYLDYKASSPPPSPPSRCRVDASQEFDPLKLHGSGTSLAGNDTSGFLSHIGSRLTSSIPPRITASKRVPAAFPACCKVRAVGRALINPSACPNRWNVRGISIYSRFAPAKRTPLFLLPVSLDGTLEQALGNSSFSSRQASSQIAPSRRCYFFWDAWSSGGGGRIAHRRDVSRNQPAIVLPPPPGDHSRPAIVRVVPLRVIASDRIAISDLETFPTNLARRDHSVPRRGSDLPAASERSGLSRVIGAEGCWEVRERRSEQLGHERLSDSHRTSKVESRKARFKSSAPCCLGLWRHFAPHPGLKAANIDNRNTAS